MSMYPWFNGLHSIVEKKINEHLELDVNAWIFSNGLVRTLQSQRRSNPAHSYNLILAFKQIYSSFSINMNILLRYAIFAYSLIHVLIANSTNLQR